MGRADVEGSLVMSPLLKYTAAAAAGGFGGTYLGTFLAGKLPASVPAEATQLGSQIICVYVALRFAGAGK